MHDLDLLIFLKSLLGVVKCIKHKRKELGIAALLTVDTNILYILCVCIVILVIAAVS